MIDNKLEYIVNNFSINHNREKETKDMHSVSVKISSLGSSIVKALKINLINTFNSRMSILVLISIIIQSIIFMVIIQSDGSSTIDFDKTEITISNIMTIILLSLLIISFSFLFPGRKRILYLVMVNILFSILMIGDLWYYRSFDDFLSLNALPQAQNLNYIMSGVATLPRMVDLIFLADNLLIILLAGIFREETRFLKRQKVVFFALFIVPAVILINRSIYITSEYVPILNMKNLTPVGYHFYDAYLYFDDISEHSLSEREKQQVHQWISYKNENLPDNEYNGIFKDYNVIFIQAESLENFVINQSYKGQAITPNLNKLLDNSFYFSNFYSQINNGNSSDADLLSNASVLPIRRGSTFFRYPNNQYTTLGKLLQQEKYSTKAMDSSSGTVWNVAKALKNFGFDKFNDMNSFKNARKWGMGITDESLFNNILDSIESDKNPYYYYCVTVTSHMPFDLRYDMRGLEMTGDFSDSIMGKYFQAIHYADEQIGNFINALDKKGLLDNTIVVIYGDHEGVHKYYDDKIYSNAEYQSWWDNNSKLPFIIYEKKLKGKEITTNGGQVDIMPTIASLLGIEKSKYESTTMGRNLLNTNKSYAILNDGTIIGKEKLSKEDIEHIEQSFDIADKIIETDYFGNRR